MPLYISNYTSKEGGWAVWKVTESEEELLALLPASGHYYNEINSLHVTPKRLQERLAVRVLMYTCWGKEHQVSYKENGKPYLTSQIYQISISHTQGYVALCWHPTLSVGIDIEQIRPKALKLTSRFMHPDEHAEGEMLQEALLYWSAKETLYKILPCQEGTDFVNHLFIHPFIIKHQGAMCGMDRREPNTTYQLNYLLDAEFVLTWHHQ